MSNKFENKREVIAHLAGGGRIHNVYTGDVLYMTEDGVLCVQGVAKRISIDQIFYNEVGRYTEPNKYSLEVWFSQHPSPTLFNNGDVAYLFGEKSEWNSTYGGDFNKKYRITVEEVRE